MKISYGITVHNEHEELNQLLELLINKLIPKMKSLLFKMVIIKKLKKLYLVGFNNIRLESNQSISKKTRMVIYQTKEFL